MIQGTASHVGKSVLVAALCRIFYHQGLRVAPFKAQNMALNSFITQEGGEIGRAQAFQARAAGVAPSVDMNPILLKPSSDTGAQVIINGKVHANMNAKAYHEFKPHLRGTVQESLNRLKKKYDIILMEGAGSPAEINLKENDLVNMGAARMAGAPVLLTGDIDRGGVFASLYGTVALLDDEEQPYLKGMIINKFRGDISLLTPGLSMIEDKTGLPVMGVIPYFHDLYLPEEDSVGLKNAQGPSGAAIKIGVVRLPHISNFTDFDVLAMEPDVSLVYIDSGEDLQQFDAIILPGSKNTLTDFSYLSQCHLTDPLVNFASGGGTVIGLCGGYQILGRVIRDPGHFESELEEVMGLGLLDVTTTLHPRKTTTLDEARFLDRAKAFTLTGYEIHMGVTEHGAGASPLFEITSRNGTPCKVRDGASNSNGRIWGTYLHGIFDNDAFRHDFLNTLRQAKGLPVLSGTGIFYEQKLEESLDRLSETVSNAVDMEAIMNIIDRGMA